MWAKLFLFGVPTSVSCQLAAELTFTSFITHACIYPPLYLQILPTYTTAASGEVEDEEGELAASAPASASAANKEVR